MFCYEFLGTFCLVGAINASTANPAAIGLTFFFLLMLCSPVSGGHMNPAVTIGVFINKVSKAREDGTFGSLVLQAFNMIFGQVCGALFSMEIFFCILERKQEDGEVINASDFPHLKSRADAWEQAMSIEMIVTCIFVGSVLLVKNNVSKVTVAGEDGLGIFGCAVQALSLTGMILVAGNHTGASLNPAVSIS